jgi:hypothetical protein
MGDVDAVANAARENQRMKDKMSEWLLDTGILQFGYFVKDAKVAPVRFCPEYLPACPGLLAEVAKLALLQFDTSEVDHLIVTADSVPLGLVCSLQSGLSLVYSRGRGEAAVYDLVGSYNSGNISALLLNFIDDVTSIEKFISNVRSVGLEIKSIVVLLEMRHVDQLAGISVQSVFRLVDIVQELMAVGRLSEGQAQAVMKWIADES